LDVARAIRRAVDTGRVVLGERETLRSAKEDKVKLVIVASNCKASSKEELERCSKDKVFVYEFPGSSVELGSVCGKPYVVSMLGVLEAGESEIFELTRRQEVGG
jgi:large subunit ribosomal protein L30e